MSTADTGPAATKWGMGPNAEAIEAWDGPLYDRFLRFRHIVTKGLGRHGEEALELLAPKTGQRVLDIGCGFGDSALQIAELVGPSGSVLGVDAAARFIESARQDAEEAGAGNVRFEVADVQDTAFEQRFDLAFSRFGTMFFANPVAAMRNVCNALEPGGALVMVVWRRRIDNDWLYRAQTIVEDIVDRPEEHEEPTCGPGPFSMSDADTTSEVLTHAGFCDISLRRCDIPILIGRDVQEAIDVTMSIGPAGEILRLAGERASHLHDTVESALREGFAEYMVKEGVLAPASTWIVTARPPNRRAG